MTLISVVHLSIGLLELAFIPTQEWADKVQRLWNEYLHEISPRTHYKVVSLEEGVAMPHDPRYDIGIFRDPGGDSLALYNPLVHTLCVHMCVWCVYVCGTNTCTTSLLARTTKWYPWRREVRCRMIQGTIIGIFRVCVCVCLCTSLLPLPRRLATRVATWYPGRESLTLYNVMIVLFLS